MLPHMAGKTRLQLRCTDEFKARVRDAAAEMGQTLTTFQTRALEAAMRDRVHGGVAPPRAEER